MTNISNTKENTKKYRILIVDDSELILRLVSTALKMDNFEIHTACNGREGLKYVRKLEPDLIILDVMMPYMNGFEVCHILKENVLTRHIPVIMLSAKGESEDKVTGLNMGADDYLTKPFSTEELRTRVRTLLERTKIYLDTNPSTKLPGNVSIEREIVNRIVSGEEFAVCYADLDNFKGYNDYYGFQRGDKVISSVGEYIYNIVQELGNPDDFAGHIGGDDFLFISTLDKIPIICEQIMKQTELTMQKLYDLVDLERGYIIAKNRQGITMEFPIMTISMVVITNKYRDIIHPAQIGEIEAELKEKVKRLSGSNYLIDYGLIKEYEAKIVLAEKDYYEAQHIKKILEQNNYWVILTRNGAETIQMAWEEKPDLVLMKPELSLVNGYEVIRLLKQIPELKYIPTKLLLSSDNKRDKGWLKENIWYIESLEQLLQKLKNLLSTSQH